MDESGSLSLLENTTVVFRSGEKWPKAYLVNYILLFPKLVVCPLIVIGNALTITVILKYQALQTVTNVMIVFLAIADFNISLTGIFDFIIEFTEDTAMLKSLCMIVEPWKFAAICLNVTSILMVAFERFVLITMNNFYKKHVTIRKGILVALLLWIYIITNIVVIYTFGGNFGEYCMWQFQISRPIYRFYIIPQYIVFTIVIISIYVKIAHFVQKQKRMLQDSKNISNRSKKNRSEMKMIQVMVMVLRTYLLSSVPVVCVDINLSLDSHDGFMIAIKLVHFIFYNNAWFNPIIYSLKIAKFRVACKKLLCFVSRNVEESLHSTTGVSTVTSRMN